MSRGVKDLRELICVSRLTVRDSDEETNFSDEEGRLSRALDDLMLSSGSDSRQSSAHSIRERTLESPDSGFGTNGNGISPDSVTNVTKEPSVTIPQPPTAGKPQSGHRKKRKRKKPAPTVATGHDIPKLAPLPPVKKGGNSQEDSSSDMEADSSVPVYGASSSSTPGRYGGNYDDMLFYCDATVVSEWLVHANESRSKLLQWCSNKDNFVQFAHFWLSDFPDMQRQEIFHMEHSIILDHLSFSFAAGRDSGKIRHKDLTDFLGAVFREYPGRLLSSKGSHLFLDYLDILSSERREPYKKLLSDVRCSTRIKQYAQCILAIRAFTLLSVWSAVMNFYLRLVPSAASSALPSSPSHDNVYITRSLQAIRNGYVDVINYMLRTKKVSPDACDAQGRSLLFTAAVHNKIKVLHFLLTQVKPRPNVNLQADNGNSPLHAAANSGNVAVVKLLLQAPGVQVDLTNPECEDATPLHLAVMHGHKQVAELLLKAKASTAKKMGDLTPIDIARNFDHHDIYRILRQIK